MFLNEFEKLLASVTKKGSDFTVTVGDFNVRSTTWWSGDITTTEGTNTEPLTSCHWFEQVINEPTHILSNSAESIDLISVDKPNLIVEGGLFWSLYVKCYHQIIFSKFNLNVVYLPLYQRLIWDYKKTNVDCIRTSLNSVDWDFALSNKNVNQQAQYLNKLLMNVFSNCISKKLITIDDIDLPWMNVEFKTKIRKRDIFYEQLKKHKLDLTDFDVKNELTSELFSLFLREEKNIIFSLLIKIEWSAEKCKDFLVYSKNNFSIFTNKRHSSVVFDDQDIIKIIRALNINKTHGYDDISIRMIKICDSALVKPCQ